MFSNIPANGDFDKNYVGAHGGWIQDRRGGEGLGPGSDAESLERFCCKEEQKMEQCLSGQA